jgi:hypothetical protein
VHAACCVSVLAGAASVYAVLTRVHAYALLLLLCAMLTLVQLLLGNLHSSKTNLGCTSYETSPSTKPHVSVSYTLRRYSAHRTARSLVVVPSRHATRHIVQCQEACTVDAHVTSLELLAKTSFLTACAFIVCCLYCFICASQLHSHNSLSSGPY